MSHKASYFFSSAIIQRRPGCFSPQTFDPFINNSDHSDPLRRQNHTEETLKAPAFSQPIGVSRRMSAVHQWGREDWFYKVTISPVGCVAWRDQRCQPCQRLFSVFQVNKLPLGQCQPSSLELRNSAKKSNILSPQPLSLRSVKYIENNYFSDYPSGRFLWTNIKLKPRKL